MEPTGGPTASSLSTSWVSEESRSSPKYLWFSHTFAVSIFFCTVCVFLLIEIPIKCLFVECVLPSSALDAMEFTQEDLPTRNGDPWFEFSCFFFPFLSVPPEVGHPKEFEGDQLASVGNKKRRKLLTSCQHFEFGHLPVWSCIMSASDDSTTSKIKGSTPRSNSGSTFTI